MNIRNSFAVLSYVFRMSANKLSYEKFTKELRKNYEKHTTIDQRVTRELRRVYEKFTKLFVTLSQHFRKCILRSSVHSKAVSMVDTICGFLCNFEIALSRLDLLTLTFDRLTAKAEL